MNNISKNIILGVFIAVLLYLMWYFSSLVIYTSIAAVISIIGRPIVKFLDGFRIRRFKLPHVMNVIIALLVIIGTIAFVAAMFVPLIAEQARVIMAIDVNAISVDMRQRFHGLQDILHQYGILGYYENLDTVLISKAKELVSFSSFADILGNVVNIASNLLTGFFSVIFISFFFLKEETLFTDIILMLVPEQYDEKTAVILRDARRLLSRYFTGVCLQLCIMMTIEVTGLSLFGVPNALLIGTFGGMMNIVPYVGPIIGASAGILIGVSSLVSTGNFNDVIPTAITIICVFSFANLVDNFVIQPFVFSNRVKAHPLEIFFVVLMAGSVAGIPGMILAIPTYTVLRVIAREFFDKFSVIHNLTKNM
jgi:predicted PurR-regulated permease PerM